MQPMQDKNLQSLSTRTCFCETRQPWSRIFILYLPLFPVRSSTVHNTVKLNHVRCLLYLYLLEEESKGKEGARPKQSSMAGFKLRILLKSHRGPLNSPLIPSHKSLSQHAVTQWRLCDWPAAYHGAERSDNSKDELYEHTATDILTSSNTALLANWNHVLKNEHWYQLL